MQTPEEYEKEYSKLLQQEQYQMQNLTEFILSGLIYDATWAMALGLHNALEMVMINDSSGCDHLPGKLVPLEDFDYLNERMGCVLRKSLHQVHFLGITVSRIHNDRNECSAHLHCICYCREIFHSTVMEAGLTTQFVLSNTTCQVSNNPGQPTLSDAVI